VSVPDNQAIDRLVLEIASVSEESRLAPLFAQLDLEAEKVWFVDQDYASVALVKAAAAVASPGRRQELLRHALHRARQFASFATSGSEGMSRMREVERIQALLGNVA
jgi:hypothetical protein